MFALKFAPAEIAEAALAPIPNLKMESYAVYTDRIPGCMMRGVGNSQFNFIFGRMVDGLAERLDMDPIELALKNFGHAWGICPDQSLTAVLKTGAARIGWAEKRHKPGQGPLYEGVLRRGVGFSLHPGWHAEWQEERRGQVQAKITLHPDGTVTLDAPTVETGTGSNTCNVLGCAEALGFLGVRPEDITWVSTVDTDSGMRDCVQTDSAVSFLQSEVLAVAARAAQAEAARSGGPGARGPGGSVDRDRGPDHRTGAQHQREGVAVEGRPGAAVGDGEPAALGEEDGSALYCQLRRGGGGHRHRPHAGAQTGHPQRLWDGDVCLRRGGATRSAARSWLWARR